MLSEARTKFGKLFQSLGAVEEKELSNVEVVIIPRWELDLVA
jgi:hypothetical protein